MKQDLMKDLSALSHINTSTLSKLVDLCNLSICDSIYEMQELDEDDILSVDIGVGQLDILISSDTVTYEFIPSNNLEKKIISTLENRRSPLVNSLESNIGRKFYKSYKELL